MPNNTEKTPHLLKTLPLLHTTPLGACRIRDNLSLGEGTDPVAWCRAAISDPETAISRRGKNWYATTADCIITVNARSHTIITAHRRGSKGDAK